MPDPVTADLLAGGGRGPLWGLASDDLNATLLAWPGGDGVASHVNSERDVLVIGVAGEGTVTIEGDRFPLRAGTALLVPKGSRRAIEASAQGVRYLTVHLRRDGLTVASAPASARS